ncbi:Rieske (2Fe-2S) protein [Nesterenkonia sp. LB17]|uniref:Rieske (2Fe-2S) protein n=1 Tax=unclassified Nesterenkonia TaxID=2629769 RepID=UPI001F4D0A10|nr:MULTISPECIES: Rieske (2Fe-2S) protein [unclassified Nesterenkonia]MCH8561298.1 Rieske (2Fe-2S) protein [Nesterenkonia sp. DZ6]MCH8562388.1 Rieske (2Fe-2S) protein [Nesterenkonia sp. YGD6]MCH8565324.1 Rieske (2Fe-2S) protein [Nesterenkonia sp. LB17]MCH8571242.1 Rieske (2Fe-2S) protein [Nesterenkonia sp. AY15]
MTSPCCDRRRFLHASALTAGSAALLTACGTDESPEPATPTRAEGGSWTEVMPLADLEVGASSTAEIGETQLLLHRSDEDTVHAFSAVCTHEGCAVGTEPERFACPCHGSIFNLETGAAEGGPARDPLTRYPAEIDGEAIRVQA